MKKVLGLDLGPASSGWAMIYQAENEGESSSIIKAGVRVNPLTVDEKSNFEQGKAITTNAGRTAKRAMRRNLQRYKQRRDHLISVLKREHWISEESILSEDGSGSTYETLRLRAEAPIKEISLLQLSRVLLSINKKRGYKSSRKASGDEEGHLIDGMEVARKLYENNMTPGQYSFELVKDGKKSLPDYYRSDLEKEYETIWNIQKQFHPEILTEDFHKQLSAQGRNGTAKIFLGKYGIFTAINSGKDKKYTALKWRCDALKEELDKETLAYVLADIREEIRSSSGYLGAISDRSKELYFNNLTVGQYLYSEIISKPGAGNKNKVFYRQDYLDEFERIWECQRQYHPELNDALKAEIRDIIIFYQRPLKSQKGLISFCEFESRDVEVEIDGKKKIKKMGCRVAPKSSLLFQEFKVWQILNNLEVYDSESESIIVLTLDQLEFLARNLTARFKMSGSEALRLLGFKGRRYSLNYKTIEGNATMAAIYGKCLEIVSLTGNGEYDASKLPFDEIDGIIRDVFEAHGFNTGFLRFNSDLSKEDYEKQDSFRLWHLLYSYEGDNSATGDESLINKVSEICGMPKEYAKILCGVKFVDDYSSLSHKAIRKILPYLKYGNRYDVACSLAGYNHSHSKTAEELANKELVDKLEVLPKGSLRNPVVEKILNQMINVVNQVSEAYGRPDEIHVELARELKMNQKQRQEMTDSIASRTKENEAIIKILQDEFKLTNVKSNDILRYRLYEELKENGYHTLYSNKYIPRELIFSKDIDIEHIIPQARMFNDSFSNKTLEFRDVNIDKGAETARDYVERKYGKEGYEEYARRIADLFARGCLGKAKRDFLLMKGEDIPSDFLNRDLTNTQYIAKKATEILESYVKTVVTTTGSITSRLREDWQLVDVMKELNLPKYRAAGLTHMVEREEGGAIEKIDDWSKRNDHRHHAMDAITIAFTRRSHIQILNNLNASSDKDSVFYALKRKEMGRNGAFYPPIPMDQFRPQVKDALESILVSIKAKNKVVTKNTNKSKTGTGRQAQVTLTPRGSLHMEQVYGKRLQYETYYVPVGAKMTAEVIETVASARERNALRERLAQYDGNTKKAFTGPNSSEKNPIYVDPMHTQCVPAKVKCVRFKTVFGIRKEIAPGFKIDKVADPAIKKILQARIDEFDGNANKAFSNLDENPIWLNQEKGISIKRVTVFENFDLVALRDKKDKDGKVIIDINGNPIPTDYVNLRNNHHIAIYKDAEGKLQEVVVPFFEALQRITAGYPAVNKEYKRDEGWSFVFSLKVNEMFVFPNQETGFDPSTIDLTDPKNYKDISPNLYRVQKLSSSDYWFRHHFETTIENNSQLQNVTWRRLNSVSRLENLIKIRIDNIGRIVSVGEYD